MKQSCLILSYRPVPAPEHTQVEGGGLRCWGLAKGLKTNDPELDIVVAYNSEFQKTNFSDSSEGIKITTWSTENIKDLISNHSCIIISYCMGEASVAVADAINDKQMLILDCYVPAFIEVSARNSSQPEREYKEFKQYAEYALHVLKRGDLFLCANEAQMHYYKGMLSALGIINPLTYNEESILIVPYGINSEPPKFKEKPITKIIDNEECKKILWFGGIYPWFDLHSLLDAIKIINSQIPVKLIIVGAKNPFVTHPDFLNMYQKLIDYIKIKNLEQEVITIDWVKFEERADWYLDSDLVVVINKIGYENKLAWRTRLVDFIWADLPVITNGGDPLGELLIENNAAFAFRDLSAKIIAEDILTVFKDKARLLVVQKNIDSMKSHFYWENVTKQLLPAIYKCKRLTNRIKLNEYDNLASFKNSYKISKIKKCQLILKDLKTYFKQNGLLNSYFYMRTILIKKLKKIGIGSLRSAKIICVTPHLDDTNVPMLFVDVIRYLRQKYSRTPIELHTFNPSSANNIRELNKSGIRPRIYQIKNDIGNFVKGDVVVLNTTAHSLALKEAIFNALENDIINQLIWYIHEDKPELNFLNKNENIRITKFLNAGKIIIFCATIDAFEYFKTFFHNSQNIRVQLSKNEMLLSKTNTLNKIDFMQEKNSYDAITDTIIESYRDSYKRCELLPRS